ncbi:MAG TPA: DUF1592 domain-containing protein [Polyangia bacterium]
MGKRADVEMAIVGKLASQEFRMKHWIAVLLPCVALACVDGSVGSGLGGASPGSPSTPNGTGQPGQPGSGNPGGNPNPGMPGGTPNPGMPGTGEPNVPIPPTGLPMPSACTNNVPGPRLLRRLTTVELDNTLQELFRDTNVPKSSALSDAEVLGFHVDAAQLVVRDLGAQQLSDYADEVAQWAITNKLATLSTCTSNDATCRQNFIRSFGRRAFRAPLTDTQLKAYDALFAAEPTFNDGATAVLTAMLQSPNLLYRREIGKPDPAKPGQFILTPHEVATNLAYFLTQGPPDDALAQAADAGMLSTNAQLDAHAERLLKTPRGRKALAAFARGWLGIDRLEAAAKDDTVFPFPPELRRDLVGETEALFTDVFDRNATLKELLTTPVSFVNASLSKYYGINSGAGGAGYIRVMRPVAQRDPGVLGHGSVLATHATGPLSSPVKRGKLIRTRLLCQPLPPPPQDVDTVLEPATASQTTRERYLQHTKDPACAGCHKVMDPIGFGFERYDGFGRRRDTENGVAVDATGTLSGVGSADIAFNGVSELSNALADSQEVKSCLVRYWSYFAYGVASWKEDACTQSTLLEEANKNQFSLKGVLMAIIHSPHFTRRVGN